MFAYRVTVIATECLVSEEESRRIIKGKIHKYADKSAMFCRNLSDGFYIFISDIDENIVTIGGIAPNVEDTGSFVESYVNYLNINYESMEISEILLETLESLLTKADRQEYIEDDTEILEKNKLNDIIGGRAYGISYDESLIRDDNRDLLKIITEKNELKEVFLPELKRILMGKADQMVQGHPVHYMIEVDNKNDKENMEMYLLQALYRKRRIRNKRYSVVSMSIHEPFKKYVYEALYEASEGGCIIVNFCVRVGKDDDDYADVINEKIQVVCEMLKKYRNKVLTLICIPKDDKKRKQLFYDELENISLIELRENLIKENNAIEYLERLTRKNHISSDQRLRGKVEKDKNYYTSELQDLFEEWYDHKLKTEIYPQYRDVAVIRNERAKSLPKGSAYHELQEMVGITEAKKVIEKALNYYKVQKLYREKEIKNTIPAMHMIFQGNPGTAKTTVARLFAQIMKDNEIVSTGQLIEVGRGDLVGKYVGWTAQCVKKKFKDARGGVLFIDEAYSLVDEKSGSFGDEAINTIVQEMENQRENVIVIFAGYPDKMEDFIKKNPGLRSRIAFHVPFPDYDVDELCEIAKLIANKQGFCLTEEALEKLKTEFKKIKGQNDFGNGRYVRNILEQAQMNQATRLMKKNIDQLTEKDVSMFTAEDIELSVTEQKTIRRIGF